MMYDTAIKVPKLYQQVMSQWTGQILDWSGGKQVLFGVPAYDDAGVEYHAANVENLENAIWGIHAGLNRKTNFHINPAGVAIYCEWEMDDQEWSFFKKEFERGPGT